MCEAALVSFSHSPKYQSHIPHLWVSLVSRQALVVHSLLEEDALSAEILVSSLLHPTLVPIMVDYINPVCALLFLSLLHFHFSSH